MVSIKLVMRVRFELFAGCASRRSRRQPARNPRLALLKVGRRITDLRHPFGSPTPNRAMSASNHIRMRTPPPDLVAADGGIDQAAF